MTNKELQKWLKKFPADAVVCTNSPYCNPEFGEWEEIYEFHDEGLINCQGGLVIKLFNPGANLVVVEELVEGFYDYHGDINSDVIILSYIGEIIEKNFKYKNLDYIDSILKTFQPERSRVIVCTNLLRITSRAKKLLPSWEDCLNRTIKYLDDLKLDTKHLLRGLI